jgi:hypothetical protein
MVSVLMTEERCQCDDCLVDLRGGCYLGLGATEQRGL